MYKTIYSVTSATKIYISHKCSICGTQNTYQNNIVETASLETKDPTAVGANWNGKNQFGGSSMRSVGSEKTRKAEERYARAEEGADQALEERVKRILNEEKSGKYRSAQFYCPCKKCGHLEPWSKLRYNRILQAITNFFLIIAGIYFIALCCVGEIGGAFLGLFLLSTPAISWYTFKYTHRYIMEKRIELLPKQCLPTISLKEDDIFMKTAKTRDEYLF